MKRDNDYLRELLFEFESKSDYLIHAHPSLCDTEADKKWLHHIRLLDDYGYLSEINEGVYRLTAYGYDFIDSIRDDGVWEKTKKAVAETGGNATVELIKSIASGFLKEKLEKHTGLEL